MNVLGVAFDSKLNWQIQVQSAITKAKTSLNAVKLISKHFKKHEILQILTSNYYSILYYNSKIWHLPTLSHNSKQMLFSASATPLKICTPSYNPAMSHNTLHLLNKRATPDQFLKYKTALTLFKFFNSNSMSFEWQQLFFNQNFNQRNVTLNFTDLSRYKIGKNLITNRFNILNNQIPHNWLNLTFLSFKIKCKEKFLSV